MNIVVLAAGGAAIACLVWLFAPWTLWTRSRLDEEPLPATAFTEIGRGPFVRQEHRVSGTARLLELSDGRRVLRLEDFATSDGPDLHVWLSEKQAGGNWFKYGTGRNVRLGALKATDGNHNYPIPDGQNLDGIASAVIWCRRFRVAFGSASIRSGSTASQ